MLYSFVSSKRALIYTCIHFYLTIYFTKMMNFDVFFPRPILITTSWWCPFSPTHAINGANRRSFWGCGFNVIRNVIRMDCVIIHCCVPNESANVTEVSVRKLRDGNSEILTVCYTIRIATRICKIARDRENWRLDGWRGG